MPVKDEKSSFKSHDEYQKQTIISDVPHAIAREYAKCYARKQMPQRHFANTKSHFENCYSEWEKKKKQNTSKEEERIKSVRIFAEALHAPDNICSCSLMKQVVFKRALTSSQLDASCSI